MKSIVQDIGRAVEAKAYLSALALALTLPDICSQVKFSHTKSSGQSYQAWFDEYVKSRYLDTGASDPELPEFDGLACWKLRCGVLHSGNVGIDTASEVDIQIFELCVSDAPLGAYAVSSSLRETDNSMKGTAIEKRMRISVEWLCFAIGQAAVMFFQEWETKQDFERHSIPIERL